MRAVLLAAVLLAPGALAAVDPGAVDVMPDGFRIRYHFSETDVWPGALDLVRSAVRENYEDFLSWGLRGGWPDEGHVWVDDDRGAQCVACVVSNTSFQVHVSLAGAARTPVSSHTFYPDQEGRQRTTIGHEVFHNFQNAYVQPENGARMIGAYTEGLARMQETLHAYSGASHQPLSLVYSGNVNGCNNELAPEPHPVAFPPESPVQWVPDGTLAEGPATNQSYSACSFWIAWYGHHGRAGLVELLETAPQHRTKEGWQEMHDLLEATSGPVDDELARYAALALTGRGAAFNGLDWGEHLARWKPDALARGEARTERLADGGMMGALVAEPGIVAVESTLPVSLYAIGADGSFTRIANGSLVDRPWIVAVLPGVGVDDVTLRLA